MSGKITLTTDNRIQLNSAHEIRSDVLRPHSRKGKDSDL